MNLSSVLGALLPGAPAGPARGFPTRIPPPEAPESGSTRTRPTRRQDEVQLSPEGLQALAGGLGEEEEQDADPLAPTRSETETGSTEKSEGERASGSMRGADGEPLTPAEEDKVRELQARDREVRAHEQAHKAAAGDLALGGPTYETERGPDGRDYAVGGEVQISMKPGRTPEDTARNAERAQRAALAPASPSPQDRRVAADAARMQADARREAREEETEAAESEGNEATAPESTELGRRASVYGEVAQGATEEAGSLLGSLFG